jgi:hypothetical protein
MGFVENPASDLSLGDGIRKRTFAELFRRDIQARDIPEPDFAQNIAPFGWSEETTERRGEGCFGSSNKTIYLVLHQGWRGEMTMVRTATLHLVMDGPPSMIVLQISSTNHHHAPRKTCMDRQSA